MFRLTLQASYTSPTENQITNHFTSTKNPTTLYQLARIAGGQAVKNRAGERPPAGFGFVFQVPVHQRTENS